MKCCSRYAVTGASLVVVLVAMAAHAAETFPSRPIRLISPFAAGGGNDMISRAVAQALTRNLGHSVVVDNRPGANTIIGMELVAKSPPDGYTLIMTGSTVAINATLHANLPYDSLRDFAAVTQIAATPLIVAVHPSLPVASVRELIALAKARPGELNFPSAGVGNVSHLAGELFNVMAGVRLVHVPYKGSAPATADLLAGRVSVVFNSAFAMLPFVKSGRLRALAVSGRARSALLPAVPTVNEAGVPGYEASTWYGLLAPAATPRAVIERLQAETVKALTADDVRRRLIEDGLEPVGSTPAEFGAYIRTEIAKWARVISVAGIAIEQ